MRVCEDSVPQTKVVLQDSDLIYLSGFRDKPSKKIIWKSSDIPKYILVPVGDMLRNLKLFYT
jgi:hypothetical protein